MDRGTLRVLAVFDKFYRGRRSETHDVRGTGLGLRDRILGDPDRAGRFARASLGFANVANRLGPALAKRIPY